LDKVVKERESEESLSVSSQAYKLFLAGKSPIDVAIALNLWETDVTHYTKSTGLYAIFMISLRSMKKLKTILALF
jgi:hypothetical protein